MEATYEVTVNINMSNSRLFEKEKINTDLISTLL